MSYISQLTFVLRIEFIRSKLSIFSVHVSIAALFVTVRDAALSSAAPGRVPGRSGSSHSADSIGGSYVNHHAAPGGT